VIPVPRIGWQKSALCAEVDPAIFEIASGQTATNAVKVCTSCPVRLDCLGWYMATLSPARRR
jgi:WhiB family redox-sensing transcriptional regulator